MSAPLDKQTMRNMAAQLQHNIPHQEIMPDMLQPTADFLDYANRDVRRHFCILTDAEGESFFLRPDFTLPTCLHYARSENRSQSGQCFFYQGQVWLWDMKTAQRQQFMQMGVEHIGKKDEAETAAAILAATQAALAETGITNPVLRMGDPSLFDLVIDALAPPESWRVRLKKLFRRNAGPSQLAQFFAQAQATMDIRTKNTAEANINSTAELDDFLKNNNIIHIGARRREEIVERLREQNALHTPDLSKQVMEVIRAFLNIAADHPERALENILAFSQKNNLGLDEEISELSRRFDAMSKTSIKDIFSSGNALFAPYFQGAYLNYYTGLVFAFLPSHREMLASKTDSPLAGGGHYNGLLRALGIQNGTGVGATIYLDEVKHHA